MKLARYLLLVLLLTCGAAECLGQSKKTTRKREWRDLINTSLSGEHCKPADNPYGFGARICQGLEGYSLLLTGDETKPEVFLIAPGGQKTQIEYWDTTDSRYQGMDPVVLWVLVNEPKKTIALNFYLRIDVGPGWNGSYDVIVKVSPGPVCIVGSVAPGSTSAGESVGIASSPENRPCLGLTELWQENWFRTAQQLANEDKIEEAKAALAKIKEPSERFIAYKEIASAILKNGDRDGAYRLLKTARAEALKKPLVLDMEYSLIHVTAGLTEAGFYDEAKADIKLYKDHDQMKMRLMIAWYQGERKDFEAAKVTYREIIELALNSGSWRDSYLQDACQGQARMQLYDEALKTAALIISPDHRRMCEDYIPKSAPQP
jgi:tetratricopeptide (TPR) repeat protein